MNKQKKGAARAATVDAAEVAVFTPDENTSIPARIDRAGGTVWLTQAEIAALFGVERSVITKHLANAEAEELAGLSTCANFAQVAADDKTRTFKVYNLDAVLSVGYRVHSPRGVAFRRWASGVLRERIAAAAPVPAVGSDALAARVASLEGETRAVKANYGILAERVGEAVKNYGQCLAEINAAAVAIQYAASKMRLPSVPSPFRAIR